jgi:cell wall-associated NlpC family hydrolase
MKTNRIRGLGVGKRLAAFFLAVAMTGSIAVSASAITQADIDATAAKIEEMQAQQASLQSQQADVQSQLDELEEQENSALDQLVLYQQQAELLESQIDNTKAIIEDYEVQIADTEVKLEEAQEKEAQYYELFCERVRAMEENSTSSYWSILFDAESFNDLLDRLAFISEVMDYDNWVMEQLALARQEVADTKAQLEEEKAGKEAALADLEDQQAQVQAAYDQVEILLEEIRANQDVYGEKLAELESLSAALEDDIVESQEKYENQIAELKRQIEEEEARKKAEEEARKKAEAEAAAAAAAANKNTSTEASVTVSSGDSALGAEIASYGCQFIGNPYVYGGTSLTNGTDCSGFVMRVYEHFGYSLPRTSSALRSVGRAVNYSDAQPGDIICYYSSASPSGGHCGIYIGNGMMVNAASSKTGIIISSVNSSRSGFVVRRVV